MRRVLLAAILAMAVSPVRASLIAYVACADAPEIDVFAVDTNTGALTPVQKLPMPGTVTPLAIAPDRRHLYAAIRSQPTIVDVLTIDTKTGKLGEMETQPLVAGMSFLAFDHTGRVLFSASPESNLISTNHVDAKGSVDPQPAQVIDIKPQPQSLLAEPTGHYAFAALGGGDAILQYKLDPTTARLTPNTPPQLDTVKGAFPHELAFPPSGRFVYATGEHAGTLDVYALNTGKGTLSTVQTIRATADDFSGTPMLGDVQVTPDGRFLYVSERTGSTITGFRIDRGTGQVTRLPATPSEGAPLAFAIDPQGRYLIAAGQKSATLAVYAINRSSGALKSIQHADTGRGPVAIEIVETASQPAGSSGTPPASNPH